MCFFGWSSVFLLHTGISVPRCRRVRKVKEVKARLRMVSEAWAKKDHLATVKGQCAAHGLFEKNNSGPPVNEGLRKPMYLVDYI